MSFYIVILILDVMLSMIITFYFWPQKASLLKRITETANIFSLLYLICSLPFLFMEVFAVWKPLISMVIIEVSFICIKYKKIKWHKIIFEKNEIKVILFLLCVFPLLSNTTEDISTTTDQGSYFHHTVVLMEGKSKEVKYSFDHKKTNDEVVLAELIELQNNNTAFYKDEKGNYSLHSLNTWCSFSALFGKVFGIFNCMKVGIVAYYIVILNMYFTCQKISGNTIAKYFALILFGLSPLVLYIGKAGLTECFSLLFFSMAFNFFSENRVNGYIVAGISLGMLGFLHVSTFIYFPIITIVLLMLSVHYESKAIAICNKTQIVLYGLSLLYCYKISPVYVKNQFAKFTFGGKVEYNALFFFLEIALVLIIVIQESVKNNSVKNILKRIEKFYDKYFTYIIASVLIIILLRTLYFGYYISFTDKFAIAEGSDAGTWNLRNRYVNSGITAVSYLNIINVGRATGIWGLIGYICIPFINKKNSVVSKYLYGLSLYGLFFWTALQMDTPSNYYSSRYFIPFLVPLITLVLANYVNKKNTIIFIMLFSFLFYNHFHYAFLYGAPRVGQYQILEDTLEIIQDNSIVFCNPESRTINSMLTNNLRIINDCTVYSLSSIDKIETKGNKYIISETPIQGDFKEMLSGVYKSQYSFGNGVNGTYDTWIGTYNIPLHIYKML